MKFLLFGIIATHVNAGKMAMAEEDPNKGIGGKGTTKNSKTGKWYLKSRSRKQRKEDARAVGGVVVG
jgi:hypothetical protein